MVDTTLFLVSIRRANELRRLRVYLYLNGYVYALRFVLSVMMPIRIGATLQFATIQMSLETTKSRAPNNHND